MVTEDRVVLVVDDHHETAESHARLVRDLGYRASAQSDPERVEAQLFRNPDIDLVLLDIRMPKLSGMELLKRIKPRRPQLGIVMATAVNLVCRPIPANSNVTEHQRRSGRPA